MAPRTSSTKPLTPRANTKSNVPTFSRQGTKKAFSAKTPSKPNGNILNFFKKVEAPDDGALFLPVSRHDPVPVEKSFVRSPTPEEFNVGLEEDLYSATDGTERYNESGYSTKRRKMSNGSNNQRFENGGSVSSEHKRTYISQGSVIRPDPDTLASEVQETCTPPPPDPTITTKPQPRRIGAFLDDSDSEDEESGLGVMKQGQVVQDAAVEEKIDRTEPLLSMNEMVETKAVNRDEIRESPVAPDVDAVFPADGDQIPTLEREDTGCGDYGAFDDIEEYPDIEDEFADGEEFVERKWMEEQERFENADVDTKNDAYPGDGFEIGPHDQMLDESSIANCPICEADLVGTTADQVTRHVNACLDGNPIPLPPIEVEPVKRKTMSENGSSRFARAAIARVGQENPFQLDHPHEATSSAFSKLMSSKAEDAAWANAAAAETAARGKPAYKRVCPFYKIMPGFYICVDAFRYGAVQGCNAYFLSHFHSDHYIGLTSTWCHGPIYCSKATGNLVKQQLRVDPQWVVTLDFEEKVEVPDTQGVSVTMISANHCPGSSLFLFEKVVGKGPDPKVQRVLHCGDFRACPAHIEHPQLMPDIVDSVTGRTRQQKIDVCYLDTTYLNPRYTFPPQEDVIQACADMCVSLAKDEVDGSSAWELAKKERAGAGMAKFITATSQPADSPGPETEPGKRRGRLLIICGTYSIGKEKLCLGIARALDCKIWAPPGKQRICAALEDAELTARLTSDPREAQIHMQALAETRGETLQAYLDELKPHFSRVVGFRPSGWSYRAPGSRGAGATVREVLEGASWRSRYGAGELVAQRGATREAACFAVPYSEHSSFRELTVFCCALRIGRVVPTVGVGSAAGRARMKVWIDRWLAERRRNGVVRVGEGEGMVRW